MFTELKENKCKRKAAIINGSRVKSGMDDINAPNVLLLAIAGSSGTRRVKSPCTKSTLTTAHETTATN